MLRHLLHDFGVPQRLLAAEGSQGERQLTDLLHLAELLQQASAQLDGPHALIHWLAEERLDLEKTDNDTRKLRLESDADLVKVVTVHKSKGLEYALVFLPFGITAFGEAQNKPRQFSQWRDEAGQVIMALRPDAASRARIDQARLAEDLRKLYVALTRARYAAWVGIAPQSASTTALGYLLQGQEAAAALKTLAQGCAAIEVKNEDQKMNAWIPAFAGMTVPGGMAAPEGMTAPGGMAVLRKSYEVSAYSQKKAVFESAPEPPLPARVRVPWWIASYSALCQTHEVFDEDVAPLWQEDAQAETGARPPASAGLLHDFPRGPGPGSFLHGLLEWVGRQGFARVSANPETQADLADLIARRCNLSGWRHWIEPLRAWLLSWLTTPWEGSVFASPMVPAALENTQIEMEFLIAVQSVDIRAIDDLIRAKTLDGVRRPTLLPQQIGGMVKGFMDLVFEHEGRYFIVDYKSNWLGPDDTAYTASALREAVLRHRYDLQYTLYALALHRLLRVRLPGYDYERHFGGAICLFLRGHAALGQGLHCERPPKTLIEALDRAFQHG
jgi:exodeoxyribonuclease V beta subunit